MKTLLILGLDRSNAKDAKQIAESDGVDVWVCNDYYRKFPWLTPDIIFQIHTKYFDKPQPTVSKRMEDWQNKYNESGALVITSRELPEIKNQALFPIEQAVHKFGSAFFTNTFPYMFALAILEGYKKIYFRGFSEMDIPEYNDCFPSCMKAVEYAEKAGIEVDAPIIEKWRNKATVVDWRNIQPIKLMYHEKA
jgi:hypothetical protein